MSRRIIAPQYDAKLWAQFPEAHRTSCSEQEAIAGVSKLCRWARVPMVGIIFSSGRKGSQYDPLQQRIRIDRDMLSWLTVAHEFAHHWDFIKTLKSRGVGVSPLGFVLTMPRRRRWHSKAHRQMTADSLQYIKTWKSLHGRDEPFGRRK